jgi:hypothetical protein
MWISLGTIVCLVIFFIMYQKEKERKIDEKDQEIEKLRRESHVRYQHDMEEKHNTCQNILHYQIDHCLKMNSELSRYETSYIAELINKYHMHTSVSPYSIDSMTYDNIYEAIKCALICENHMQLIEKVILEENIELPGRTAYEAFLYNLPLESTDKEFLLSMIEDYIYDHKVYCETKELKNRLENLYYENVYQKMRYSEHRYPESISDPMMDHLLDIYPLSFLTDMSDEQLIEIMQKQFKNFYSNWKGY